MREADVPAQQSAAQQDARLSWTDADPWRPSGAQGATGPRPQAPRGLTRSIRDRGTFEALARARPRRRGPLSLRRVASSDRGPARVAYAVGRDVGNAVARNRARRRLRAAVARRADDLQPGSAYLFGGGRAVLSLPFEELADLVRSVIERSERP
jgi:ribonuclease P protein component